MKICPKCKATYPDGYQYCPADTEALLTADEIARLKSLTPVTVVPTEMVASDVSSSAAAPEVRSSEVTPSVTVSLPRTTQNFSVGNTTPVSLTSIAQSHQKQNGTDESVKLRMATAKTPGKSSELSFAIPEPENLLHRLLMSIKQFVRDFGKKSPKLKQGEMGDFQFLLADESLFSRFKREVGTALIDLRRDPKAFMRDVLSGEGNSKRRSQLIQAGVALGVVVYAFIFTSLLLMALIRAKSAVQVLVVDATNTVIESANVTLSQIGGDEYQSSLATNTEGLVSFNKLLPGKYKVVVGNSDCVEREREVILQSGDKEDLVITLCEERVTKLLNTPTEEIKAEKVPKEMQGKGGFTGGSKQKIEQARGGGGGGAETAAPASKGVPPKMSLIPAPLPPSVTPPKIQNPTLVVPNVALGDPKALPDLKGPIGDPKGVEGPPVPGSGSGGGIGSGKGGGVGEGEGGGIGQGKGGNTGGGNNSIGGGVGPGGSGGLVPYSALTTKPVILFKEKAKYTEEARQNKVQGSVVLSVIVTAEGTVTGVRVVRGLPDGLTEKAIEAAQKMRFKPATKNGEPVSTRLQVDFAFTIF